MPPISREAVPITRGEHNKKLVHRRPLAMAVISLILPLIVAFSVSMTILAKRARDEARTANEVNGFLVSILGANETGSSRKTEEPLKGWLRLPLARLSLHDEDEAGTLDNLGDVALDMSRYAVAEHYYREALDLHVAKAGLHGTLVAQDHARIAAAMWNLGRFPQAETHAWQAAVFQQKATGPNDLLALEMQSALGIVYQSEGRYEEAAAKAKYTLDHRLLVEAPNHPDLGDSWHNDALALASLGRYNDAEHAERQALAVRIAAFGNDHPQVAVSTAELAGILVDTGKYPEALALAQKALDIDRKTSGPEGRDLVDVRADYSRVLQALGENIKALEQAQRTLHLCEKVFSPRHPRTADAMELLGEIEWATGDRAAAEKELRTAIDIRREAFGPRHVLVASAERLLAEVLVESGQPAEAEQYAKDALALVQIHSPNAYPRALPESTLAWVELQENHPEGTIPLLQDAYNRAKAAHGAEHPQAASIGMRLARAMAANGDVQGGLQMALAQIPTLLASKDPAWHQERALAGKVKQSGSAALMHEAGNTPPRARLMLPVAPSPTRFAPE